MEGSDAVSWRKSSYSGNNGGSCVEVGATSWRKSSHSGSNGGSCVEVGTAPGAVLVRDTKDRQGPALSFSADAWRAFADRIKNEAD